MKKTHTGNSVALKNNISHLLKDGRSAMEIADKLRVSRSVIMGWSNGHYVPTEAMALVLLEKLKMAFPSKEKAQAI